MPHGRRDTDAGAGGGAPDLPLHITINPRARRLILRVDPARRVICATAPGEKDLPALHRFAMSRREPLMRELARLGLARPFVPGMVVPVYRAALALCEGPTGDAGALVVHSGTRPFAQRARRTLEAEARRVLAPLVDCYADALGKRPSRLRIGDTRSRWGSCTADGVIALSWRLIFAPPDVADYVAAHEVAHLAHHHHQPPFWAEVRNLLGRDPKPDRRWLKEHGKTLFAWGAER